MKTLKYLFSVGLFLLVFINCTEEEANFDYLNNVQPPAEVTALFQVTQDNTGLVTITPNASGAVTYNITYGDGTTDPVSVKQGGNTTHTYAEGTYTVTIEAIGITGLKTQATKDIVVSFKAPENLVVTIENDAAISKRVNVMAEADFGLSYDVYFGEPGNDAPVSANIGETASYVYQNAGTYNIRVVAKSAAIATTEYTEAFLVTAILQPLAPAPLPPSRGDANVISIFSNAYTNISVNNLNPNWGQGTIYTPFDINGDDIIQYSNLNYQGIQITDPANATQPGINATNMEKLHIDIWTADATSINVFPLPSGVIPANERFVTLTLVANQWNSFDIPLTDFTSQGLPLDNLKQFKFVGSGTVFIDNLYFWKAPAPASGLEGVWKMAPEAGSLGVGPALGNLAWFNCDAGCVTSRACYFDDTYVFTPEGKFYNVLGNDTWIEPWQGGTNACGTPVAPHNGSTAATFVYDNGAGTITLNGTGAYIGLPKAVNAGELPNVAVPSTITYNVTLTDNNNTMNVYIQSGGGVFWQYKLVRYNSPLVGTWKMAPESGSLGVGPAIGNLAWFNCDAACVTARACYYDDTYVFGDDSSFKNIQGTQTWIEPWQGGSNACGTPVAPHDGSGIASFVYNEATNKVTLNGLGAYVGLPKAVNAGELPNVAVPSAVTYDVTFINPNTISVIIESGAGVFWQYKLVRQ